MIDTNIHYELMFNNWLSPTGEQIQFIRIPKISLSDIMSKSNKLKDKTIYFIISKKVNDDITWSVCKFEFNSIDIDDFKYAIINDNIQSRNKSGKQARDLANSKNGIFVGELEY